MPALVASALLAFTLSFDEFIITLFVIGGDQTLPLYVFNHVRYGITPSVNAVASMFLIGTFTVLTLALALPSGLRRMRLVGKRRLGSPVDGRRRLGRQHSSQHRHGAAEGVVRSKEGVLALDAEHAVKAGTAQCQHQPAPTRPRSGHTPAC